MINALLMPITLIILEIYFLKEVFSFSNPSAVLNMIFGSVIYFCMFGPVNSIGYEGKAISLLETLPISPRHLLVKKFTFWGTIAELIFMPSAAIVLHQMKFNFQTVLEGTAATGLFTIACVAATISISAIFPNFDSKILQQRSTLTGKFAALGIMLLLIPVKSLDLINIFNLTVFVTILALIWIKAETSLFFRLDSQAKKTDSNLVVNTLLLFCSFAACEISVLQFFRAVAPGMDTGMWNWFLTAVIFLPITILQLFATRMPRTNTDLQIQTAPGQAKKLAIAGIFIGLTLFSSIKIHDLRAEATALFRGDVYQIVMLADSLSLPILLWQMILTLAAAALGGAFGHHLCRAFPLKKSGRAAGIAAIIALTMSVSPAALIPSAFAGGLALAVCCLTTISTGICILTGAIFAAAQAIFYIFF